MALISSYLVSVRDMISRKRADERFYNPNDIMTILEIGLTGIPYLKFGSLISEGGIATGTGIDRSARGFGDVNYLKVGNIGEYFIKYDEVETVSEDVVEKYNMTLLEPNDLLMSRVGTVGNVCIFRREDPKSAFSDNVIKIRLLNSPQINPMYVCTLLSSEYCRAQIRRYAKQSLQEVINHTSIRNLIVPLPDINTQNQIAAQVMSGFEKIKEHEQAIARRREEIASVVKSKLFLDIEGIANVEHSQLLAMLDELDKNARKTSAAFSKQKALEDFEA